jgi:hypothetical protein
LSSNGQRSASASATTWVLSPALWPVNSHTRGGEADAGGISATAEAFMNISLYPVSSANIIIHRRDAKDAEKFSNENK